MASKGPLGVALERMRSSIMRMPFHCPKRILCALLVLAASAQAQTPPDPEFELPADSGVPFLVMRATPSELVGAQARVLRVFADGRCELERPPMMRGAGRYAWQLPPGEVAVLARQALTAGLAELDVPALRASLAVAEARADGAIVNHHHLDGDILEFELRLDRFRGRSGIAQHRLERRLRFIGLRAIRERHPTDARVRRLSELRGSLDAMARSRAPVPDPAR